MLQQVPSITATKHTILIIQYKTSLEPNTNERNMQSHITLTPSSLYIQFCYTNAALKFGKKMMGGLKFRKRMGY